MSFPIKPDAGAFDSMMAAARKRSPARHAPASAPPAAASAAAAAAAASSSSSSTSAIAIAVHPHPHHRYSSMGERRGGGGGGGGSARESHSAGSWRDGNVGGPPLSSSCPRTPSSMKKRKDTGSATSAAALAASIAHGGATTRRELERRLLSSDYLVFQYTPDNSNAGSGAAAAATAASAASMMTDAASATVPAAAAAVAVPPAQVPGSTMTLGSLLGVSSLLLSSAAAAASGGSILSTQPSPYPSPHPSPAMRAFNALSSLSLSSSHHPHHLQPHGLSFGSAPAAASSAMPMPIPSMSLDTLSADTPMACDPATAALDALPPRTTSPPMEQSTLKRSLTTQQHELHSAINAAAAPAFTSALLGLQPPQMPLYPPPQPPSPQPLLSVPSSMIGIAPPSSASAGSPSHSSHPPSSPLHAPFAHMHRRGGAGGHGSAGLAGYFSSADSASGGSSSNATNALVSILHADAAAVAATGAVAAHPVAGMLPAAPVALTQPASPFAVTSPFPTRRRNNSGPITVVRGMPEPGAPVVAQHNVFGKSLFGAALAPQTQQAQQQQLQMQQQQQQQQQQQLNSDSSASGGSEQFVLSPIASSASSSSSAAAAGGSFSHISAPLPSPATAASSAQASASVSASASSPFNPTGPFALPASLPPPIALTSHFEWERVIGRGSYGEVWLARRRGGAGDAEGAAAAGERVAIKKHLAPLISINDRRAFLRRAELLKQICDVYNGRMPAPLPAAAAAPSGSGSAGGGSTPAPPGSHNSPSQLTMSFAMRIASESMGPTGGSAGTVGSIDSPSNALHQPSGGGGSSSFGFHSHHSSPQVSPNIRSFNTRKQHAVSSLIEPTGAGSGTVGSMPPVSPSSASTALVAASVVAAPFVPSTAPYRWPAHLLVHHSIWHENNVAYTVSEHCALGDLFAFFGYNAAQLQEQSAARGGQNKHKMMQQHTHQHQPMSMAQHRAQQSHHDDDESTAASQATAEDSAASSDDESMTGGLPSRRMAVAQFLSHSAGGGGGGGGAVASSVGPFPASLALTRPSSTSSFGSLVASEAPEPAETKRLEERDLWHLLAQISSILAVLHGQSVLHNDVKPDNMYVCRRAHAGAGADEITDNAFPDPSDAPAGASASALDAYPFEFKLGDLGSLVNLADWIEGSSDDEGDGAYLAPEIINPGLLLLIGGGAAGGGGGVGTAGSSGQSSNRSSFSVAPSPQSSLLAPQSSPLYSPSHSPGGGGHGVGLFGSPLSRLNSSGVVPPPAQVTPTVDIYALGSSVWTLVTGCKFTSSALRSQLLPQLVDDPAAQLTPMDPTPPTAAAHVGGDSLSMSDLLQSTPLRGGSGATTAGAPRSSFRPAAIGTSADMMMLQPSSTSAASFVAPSVAVMDMEGGGGGVGSAGADSPTDYRTPTHQFPALAPHMPLLPPLSAASPSSASPSPSPSSSSLVSASSSRSPTPRQTFSGGLSPSFHRGAATLPASFSRDAVAMMVLRTGGAGGGAMGMASPLLLSASHAPLMPLAPRDRDRASAPSTPRSTPSVRRGALFQSQSSAPSPPQQQLQPAPVSVAAAAAVASSFVANQSMASAATAAAAAAPKAGSSSALPPPMQPLHSPSHSQMASVMAAASPATAASAAAAVPALENKVEFDESRDLLRISEPMQAMIRRMLSALPSNRPSAEELHAWAVRGIEEGRF